MAPPDSNLRPTWHRIPAWLVLLLPHLISAVSFAAGIALVFHLDTNRSSTGRTLGTIGGTAAAWAVVASLAAFVLAALGRNGGSRWWLIVLAHLAALIGALGLGGFWLGMHIA